MKAYSKACGSSPTRCSPKSSEVPASRLKSVTNACIDVGIPFAIGAKLAQHLCVWAEWVVISVDYQLAPAHKCTVAAKDLPFAVHSKLVEGR